MIVELLSRASSLSKIVVDLERVEQATKAECSRGRRNDGGGGREERRRKERNMRNEKMSRPRQVVDDRHLVEGFQHNCSSYVLQVFISTLLPTIPYQSIV